MRASLHQVLDSRLPLVDGSIRLKRLLLKRLDLRSGWRALAAAARVALMDWEGLQGGSRQTTACHSDAA